MMRQRDLGSTCQGRMPAWSRHSESRFAPTGTPGHPPHDHRAERRLYAWPEMSVQRPNKVRVVVTGSRAPKGLIYDGRTFVLFNDTHHFYSKSAGAAHHPPVDYRRR